ncbi:hypothetical protein C8E89_1233 [Mycolicibacterium moriokaense]|uniref:Uncharacterized protein n=1 Tax=Mycolicibacterium moriokaense TaxID=39691 RepID=A0A318HCG3_9MYCO|nr:hypothetical protein C8E89_1233 [Mycolicibacterium moriokaense]
MLIALGFRRVAARVLLALFDPRLVDAYETPTFPRINDR